MGLEKLKIVPEKGDEIVAHFNPKELVFQKSARWEFFPVAENDAPVSHFTYSEPANLTVDLLFDSYETGQDVRDSTGAVYKLMTVEDHGDLHRPPLVKLVWGRYNFEDFQWVLNSLKQTFSLFLPDGTPVRASLGCGFRQWRSDEDEARIQKKSSPDVAKTRVVRRGETLESIAAQEYNDPARWRPIAEANGIDNPRLLAPGRVLAIPALDPRDVARGSR